MNTLLSSPLSRAPRYPVPISPALAWFLGSGTNVPEIADGLRGTVFRRMSSLVAALVANSAMMTIALIRHPHDMLQVWAHVGLGFEAARVLIIVSLIRMIHGRSLLRRRVLVDVFVASSLLWGLLIGLSCFLFIRSGDPVLTEFSVVLAVGVVGALSARNPGSPRLCVTQMTLILAPLTAGVVLHDDPAVWLLALMMPSYLVGMVTITSQLHRDYLDMLTAQHENRLRALHCGLTGLANASSFHECLGEALAEPGDSSVAVLALDLDGFKGVNDLYGHPAGDELLKMVAARLNALESPTFTAARIGGDEFAILLRGEDSLAAERLAERLIRDIATPYRLSDGIAVIGASIGIARRSDSGRDPVTLYARADRALYEAKASGKGRWRRDDAASAREACAQEGPKAGSTPTIDVPREAAPRAA